MPTVREETRTITRLAAPVVVTQVGSMMFGVVDVVMLGHYSTESLTSGTMARVWTLGTVILIHGLLMGLDPIVSQAHGAGDRRRIGDALQKGIILAVLLSVPLALLWTLTGPILGALGISPGIAEPAHGYALARIPGIPAFLLFLVARSWLQGRGLMRPAMWVVLGANIFNVVANWALIFGHLGFPSLGVAGAGYATSATQICMLVGLVVFIRAFDLQRGAWSGWSRSGCRGLGEVLRPGIPIGIQFGVEIWAFQITTLMASRFGTEAVASHAIVLNLASISFMVPLGVSIAAATRVGNLIGAQRANDAQRAAHVALVLGGAVMTVFALLFIVGRDHLPALYNGDPTVLEISALLLPIAAAFQLFDGIQVVGTGILRGMGRTRPLAVIHFIGFYCIGLPVAWYLAFHLGHEVVGIWWGLCLGLGVVAVALVLWVVRRGPATMISS
jgi:multidrug resistance protein, MATE family